MVWITWFDTGLSVEDGIWVILFDTGLLVEDGMDHLVLYRSFS